MREFFETDLWKANYHISARPHRGAQCSTIARVLEDPVPHARRIAEFLGRDLDIEAMASIVDPELYRNRA